MLAILFLTTRQIHTRPCPYYRETIAWKTRLLRSVMDNCDDIQTMSITQSRFERSPATQSNQGSELIQSRNHVYYMFVKGNEFHHSQTMQDGAFCFNILSNFQHGFRAHRSYETRMLLTTPDFTNTLNDKQQVDAVLLDFTKAFDNVVHERLLHKLAYYGVRVVSRKQEPRVVLEGATSDKVDILLCVPRDRCWGQYSFCALSTTTTSWVPSSAYLQMMLFDIGSSKMALVPKSSKKI